MKVISALPILSPSAMLTDEGTENSEGPVEVMLTVMSPLVPRRTTGTEMLDWPERL